MSPAEWCLFTGVHFLARTKYVRVTINYRPEEKNNQTQSRLMYIQSNVYRIFLLIKTIHKFTWTILKSPEKKNSQTNLLHLKTNLFQKMLKAKILLNVSFSLTKFVI